MKFKIVLTILGVLTILLVSYNVAVAKNYAGIAWDRPGLYYRVELLDELPYHYRVLTDPDPDILEAIENPGRWVWVNQTEETPFLDWVATELEPGEPMKYQENYYSVDIVFYDVFKIPEDERWTASLPLIPVALAWVGLLIYKKRENK